MRFSNYYIEEGSLIRDIRKIAEMKSDADMQKVGDYDMDVKTARAIMDAYDMLPKEKKKIMASMPFGRLTDVAWKTKGFQENIKEGYEDLEYLNEAKKTLTVPQKHQLKIAKSTLKMSDAGVNVAGGMSKDEARKFLKSVGYSVNEIKKLEENEEYINEGLDVLKKLKEIIKNKQYDKIGGRIVDMTTANAILTVHGALSLDQRKRFLSMPIDKIVEFTWKLVK